MSLICSPEEKPRLEARNGVDQLGYIDYLTNTLRAVELLESHILELHGIAVADVYPASTGMQGPMSSSQVATMSSRRPRKCHRWSRI